MSTSCSLETPSVTFFSFSIPLSLSPFDLWVSDYEVKNEAFFIPLLNRGPFNGYNCDEKTWNIAAFHPDSLAVYFNFQQIVPGTA